MKTTCKDFRIGNLVECKGLKNTCTDRKPYFGKDIYQVCVIGRDFLKLDLGLGAMQIVNYNDIKPISITDERLLRTGFKCEYMYNFKIIYTYKEDSRIGYELRASTKCCLLNYYTLKWQFRFIGEYILL